LFGGTINLAQLQLPGDQAVQLILWVCLWAIFVALLSPKTDIRCTILHGVEGQVSVGNRSYLIVWSNRCSQLPCFH